MSDDAVKQAIAEVLDGTPSQDGDGSQPETQPVSAPPPTQTKPEASDAELAEAAQRSALVDRALKRIVAREQRVAEAENSLERAKAGERKWTKATIRANLSEYLAKELGIDAGHAARALMAEALKDKAPKEYQDLANKMREEGTRDEVIEALRTELSDLRAKLETNDMSSNRARVLADYQAGLEQHLTGDLSKYPHLSSSLKNDRDWTRGAILETIQADAQHKLREYQNTGVLREAMTPEQALQVIETQMASLARRLGTTVPAQVSTKSKDQQGEPQVRKTLTGSQPTTPPPARDENDIDANYKDALGWLNSL